MKKLTLKQRRAKAAEYKRLYRQRNVIRNCWHTLRSHAKERGKTCGISFEAFERWCLETGYHLLKGCAATSAHIDRDNDDIGYEEGNLRLRENRDNVMKENMRRKGVTDYDAWKAVNTHITF